MEIQSPVQVSRIEILGVMDAQLTNEQFGARVLPKLMFDGTNITQFNRDFPCIAEFYGFADLMLKEPDDRLTPDELKRERIARRVLRNCITRQVDRLITMADDDNFMTLTLNIKSMYLHLDKRAMASAERQLANTRMQFGETISTFVGRMNDVFILLDRAKSPRDSGSKVTIEAHN